jgi:hypothetical protein
MILHRSTLTKISIILLLIITMLNLFIFTDRYSTAQDVPEPTTIPHSDSTETQPSPDWVEARHNQLRNSYDAQQSKSISEYNVLYLTDDRGDTNSLLSVLSESFQTEADIELVNNWDAVLDNNSAHTLDGLIIHQSALDLVDQKWIQAAYRNGMVVTGINIPALEMYKLIGNNCVPTDGKELGPSRGIFFISHYYKVEGSNDQITEIAHGNELQRCMGDNDRNLAPGNRYVVKTGFTQNELKSDKDIDLMLDAIDAQLGITN